MSGMMPCHDIGLVSICTAFSSNLWPLLWILLIGIAFIMKWVASYSQKRLSYVML